MAIQIQFRRGTADEWATANPILALAEMGIETDTNLFKIGNGEDQWNDLNYGGIRGVQGNSGYAGSAGTMSVANVLYVSESGNDLFPGNALNASKRTLKAALAIATRGTTIYVKSGDYTEDNPLTVPDFVSIVGDNIRTTIIRPLNVTSDLFYVNNGSYLSNMTFKDHLSPAAAVAFNPNGSAGVISTSPYVQNCTSMTTSGTGMRVDGNHALGTRSMVVDAFTQYNQGGIGIHMLNSGYTQLVSVFTICCDVGFLCETGGSCSITNSNSSFGNYALKAVGVSPTLYSGKLVGATSGRSFVVDGLNTKPSIGDAMSFGDGNYYTIAASSALSPGIASIVNPTISNELPILRNARQTILDEKSRLQVQTINHVIETFPGFDFNQFKCSRDVGTIINSICYDMVLNSNYQTILAGSSYYRAASLVVVQDQLTETLSALTFLKVRVLALLTPSTVPHDRVTALFNTLLDIVELGPESAPEYEFPAPTAATSSTVKAVQILQYNRDFFAAETVAYINGFTYNSAKCARDTGLIVDSIAFDLLYGGTSQSAFAGLQYWNKTGYVGTVGTELTTTTNAIAYVRDRVNTIALATGGTAASNTVTNNFNILLNILNSGTAGVTDLIVPNGIVSTSTSTIAAYNAILSNKTSIQSDTIAWIASNYPDFTYNTSTCYRDIGYIIDSVAFDLKHGGNRQSIMSGVYYYGFDSTSTVIAQEIPQTTSAYNFIKDISAKIITGSLITAPYQTAVNQVLSTSTATAVEIGLLNDIVSTITNIILNGPSVAPTHVPIGLTASTNVNVVNAFNLLLDNQDFIKAETIAYVNTSYVGLVYNVETCKRDVGFIIDAVSYDLLYGGNSQTSLVADAYYDAAVFRLSNSEKQATLSAYYFIKTIIDDCILDQVVTPYQYTITQYTGLPPATNVESARAQSLIDIVVNVVDNAYSSTVTIAENVGTKFNDNTEVTFHRFSLIQSSAHNFEWIGAGVNIDAALPFLGGEPISENQAVSLDGGKVYYTGTDQKGDFRIGNDLVINNNIGTISGRTFTKSLFAVMTPYILAIGS